MVQIEQTIIRVPSGGFVRGYTSLSCGDATWAR